MTMTIEFLRARLLSERAASKAAKHEADQLSKKVWPAHSGPSVLDMSSVKHFALGHNTISFTWDWRAQVCCTTYMLSQCANRKNELFVLIIGGCKLEWLEVTCVAICCNFTTLKLRSDLRIRMMAGFQHHHHQCFFLSVHDGNLCTSSSKLHWSLLAKELSNGIFMEQYDRGCFFHSLRAFLFLDY